MVANEALVELEAYDELTANVVNDEVAANEALVELEA